MTEILIVAELDGTELNPATARCVLCARSLADARISVAVFGAEATAAAESAAKLDGVAEVLHVQSPLDQTRLAALLAPQIVALAAPFTLLLAAASTFGKDLMPRVAALLDIPQISDISAIESPTRFRRPVYAGNAIATVEAPAMQLAGTVRTASFDAAGAATQPAPMRQLPAPQVQLPDHTRFVSRTAPSNERPDLQSATRVVSGGRGVGSKENFQLIYRLADQLRAAVGASRAAVDAGFVPNELQVGQTGKIIAPELYMAIGISGAIQHLTGIQDARTIVAINKDAEAPIFEIADLALVGDLFALLPELERALAERAR